MGYTYRRMALGAPLVTSVQNTVTMTQGAYELSQDPNALYAAAINSLGANPAALALLSPVGRMIFDKIYTTVQGIASDEITSIGTALLTDGEALIGPTATAILGSVGAAVSSVVSEVAPFAAMIVSNVIELAQMSSMFAAPSAAANQAVTVAVLGRTAQGTGGGAGGYAVTPADIFAPNTSPPKSGPETVSVVTAADVVKCKALYGMGPNDWTKGQVSCLRPGTYYPDPWTEILYTKPFPYSSLGLCLAGITESKLNSTGNFTTADLVAVSISPSGGNGSTDSTIRHDDVVLHVMPQIYNAMLVAAGAPAQPAVGIPYATRKTMQLLRLAMGSRASTKNGDPSTLLYTMWADLFAAAWTSGQMSIPYALFSLSHVWGPNGWNGAQIDGPGTIITGADTNPYGFVNADQAYQGASILAWTPLVQQASALVTSWLKTREAAKLLLSPALTTMLASLALASPVQMACIKAKGTWNNTRKTCTTTNTGLIWNSKTNKFDPVTYLMTTSIAPVFKITPLEGILIGATLIGAGVVGVKIAKKKGWLRPRWPRRS